MSSCQIEWEKFKKLMLNYIASVLTQKIIGLESITNFYEITPHDLLSSIRNDLENLNDKKIEIIKNIWGKEITGNMIDEIEGIFIKGKFKSKSLFIK
jgi:hypothetical protein